MQEPCQRDFVVKKRHHRIAYKAEKKFSNTRAKAYYRVQPGVSESVSQDFAFLCKKRTNFQNLTFAWRYAKRILEDANIGRADFTIPHGILSIRITTY
jgi:hypothetical protein